MISKVRSTWVDGDSRGYATDKRDEVCTRVAAYFEVDERVAQVFDGVAHLRDRQARERGSGVGEVRGWTRAWRRSSTALRTAICCVAFRSAWPHVKGR